MNEVWNLDPFYNTFEDPYFSRDLEELKAKVASYSDFAAGLGDVAPIDGLRLGIGFEESVAELAGRLGLYASLRQSANTRDDEAGSRMGQIMGIISAVAGPEAAFKDWASKLPNLMELVRGDEDLKDYEFLFSNMADSASYLLPGRGEEIAAKLRLSGGSAWSDLQQYLTSTVPVSYRGETTNLSTIRNMAYDPDPAVRKDAYEAELACYDRIRDSVAFALNSIKLETISDCQLRGYESPLARTLKRSDMKRETLDAMLGAMDEYLPKFWQYLKAKAKALGHENGLPWYDLFAPMGKSSTKFTAEEARDYLVSHFAGFDAELAASTAEASVDGNTDTVFANMTKHQQDREAKLRAELLKTTPTPPSGDVPPLDSQRYEKLAAEAFERGDFSSGAYYTRLSQQKT